MLRLAFSHCLYSCFEVSLARPVRFQIGSIRIFFLLDRQIAAALKPYSFKLKLHMNIHFMFIQFISLWKFNM